MLGIIIKNSATINICAKLKKKCYLFIFGSAGSLLLCEGFLQLQRGGASLQLRRTRFSLRAFSWCRVRASVAAAHRLKSWGSCILECRLIAVEHRFRCSVACVIFLDQRQNLCLLHCWILNHWVTREVLHLQFK